VNACGAFLFSRSAQTQFKVYICSYKFVFDNIYVVSKSSKSLSSLPLPVATSLETFGGNLAIARKRRRQSMDAWATRLQVSVPTLRRMEKGDPSVAAGVYMTAAWLMNLHHAVAKATDPKEDQVALEQEIRTANRRNTPKAEPHA
jgi:hypothetical protein